MPSSLEYHNHRSPGHGWPHQCPLARGWSCLSLAIFCRAQRQKVSYVTDMCHGNERAILSIRNAMNLHGSHNAWHYSPMEDIYQSLFLEQSQPIFKNLASTLICYGNYATSNSLNFDPFSNILPPMDSASSPILLSPLTTSLSNLHEAFAWPAEFQQCWKLIQNSRFLQWSSLENYRLFPSTRDLVVLSVQQSWIRLPTKAKKKTKLKAAAKGISSLLLAFAGGRTVMDPGQWWGVSWGSWSVGLGHLGYHHRTNTGARHNAVRNSSTVNGIGCC